MSISLFLARHYRIRPTNKDDEIRICCPFCGDQRFHGYFNIEKKAYICFRCHTRQSPGRRGWSGYRFLRRVHAMTHAEAVGVLGRSDPSPALPVASTTPDEVCCVQCPPYTTRVTSGAGDYLGRRAWSYLANRLGRDRALYYCDQYQLRYGYDGEYCGRLILPVIERGRWVHYQGRAFWPPSMEPKYINPVTSTKPLMGLEPEENLILVEGWFDAANLGPPAVAVFGSILTPDQLRRIVAARPRSVTVAFDPDGAGRKGAQAALRRLRGYVGDLRVARLGCEPSDLEPGDTSAVWAASGKVRAGALFLT